MTLDETTQLYASVLRQLLPTGGYDTSPNTEALAVDVYAHAKLLAQADLDAKRLLKVLEGFPPELISEYETEYGLPLKCTVNAGKTLEERLEILKWVRTSRNVLNRAYLEQLLAIFGVVLIDILKFKPMQCTASCTSPVNTEQLRYKVFLRLQYPVNADMGCIVENYLPGYLRVEWMIDMPWGDWILNSGVTVNTNGIAHYTAYKTNQRDYYDSYANLDLTAAIVQSLHDSDMQQWQAVIDAANELTGVTDWVLDPAINVISYRDNNVPAKQDPTVQFLFSGAYNYTHPTDLASPNAVCSALMKDEVFIDGKTFTGSYSVKSRGFADNLPLYTCIFPIISGGVYDSNVSVRANPIYDPNAPINYITRPLEDVAQKIISNASSSNQAISLLAEAYLENVAKSIFSSDESKRFVKLTDLISKFETNKTLRT